MLAFIHIHKAAGTTVHHMLRSTYGINHCDAQPWDAPPLGLEQWQVPITSHDLRLLRKLYPNLKSIASHSVHPYVQLEDECSEVRYFTLMRDPVKMGASLYQYVVEDRGKSWSFKEWMAKETTCNRQTKIIAGKVDVDEAIRVIHNKNIFVGLTERFDESMLIFQRLFAPEFDLGYERKNVAQRNNLAKDILACEQNQRMLVEANQADIQLYEYVRNELYPKFQREYGSQLKQDVKSYQVNRGHFSKHNVRLSFWKLHAIYRPLRFLYRHGLSVVG